MHSGSAQKLFGFAVPAFQAFLPAMPHRKELLEFVPALEAFELIIGHKLYYGIILAYVTINCVIDALTYAG